jgi:hypothetical protein
MAINRKLPKTSDELESIILHEVRRHPDWTMIQNVVVTPTMRSAPHNPNWDAAFIVDGAALRPADAQHLVTAMQNEYELVEE